MFYLFHVFRSFLPLQNPIGFGASDFIEFLIAFGLLLLALARDPLLRAARRLAAKPAWSMLALGGLTVALRLALLAQAGPPIPSTADDNSYLLLADTLSHFRLANPTHPFFRFFETNFVLQQPSYSSIFPAGQGIALELGRAIFGHPWAGVVVSEALLCALCYWMLRGWVSAGWALVGGLLAVCELGPLTYWMNSYWGGAVSGIAGCLVFGALPRLCKSGGARDATLLGSGLGLELLTRPYESVFLTGIVAITFLLPRWRQGFRKALPSAPLIIAAALPAIALTFAQNKAVTGSWLTLPYITSRAQYGVPTTFTFQPNPVPHRALSEEQQAGYEAQSEVHARESALSFGERLLDRAAECRFFVFPALLAALPGLFIAFRHRRMILPAAAIVSMLAGAAFYPYFYPHYIAALACVFLLLTVAGLERIPRPAAFAVLAVALVHFAFWYGVHAGSADFREAFGPYETFDFLNHGDPEGRQPILDRLHDSPGGQLVFVHYLPFHPLREWITNVADIDHSKIVWALDLGPEKDRTLADYYPGRTVWLCEPDASPPRLRPYSGF